MFFDVLLYYHFINGKYNVICTLNVIFIYLQPRPAAKFCIRSPIFHDCAKKGFPNACELPVKLGIRSKLKDWLFKTFGLLSGSNSVENLFHDIYYKYFNLTYFRCSF